MFVAISMMLVASVLLSLLEAARICTIEKAAENATNLALASLFAEYDSHLWNQCKLLGLYTQNEDGFLFEEQEKKMLDVADYYMNPEEKTEEYPQNTFLRAKIKECTVIAHQNLTDGSGQVYRKEIAEYMKTQVAGKALNELKEKYDKWSSPEKINIDKSVQEANKKLQGKKTKEQSPQSKHDTVKENPLKVFRKARKRHFLTMLLGDKDKISEKEISKTDCVSKRDLQKGNIKPSYELGWVEDMLGNMYYSEQFSGYVNTKAENALAYELEYLLFGKDNDMENLQAVCCQMILFREVVNMAYLMTDHEKMEEAALLATSLAGWTGNGAIVTAVQAAILAIWSYGESILDMRTLLKGENVPYMKSSETWTLNLNAMASCLFGEQGAKSVENGISYMDYVSLFLYLANHEKLAMRAMDLQEIRLNSISENMDFHMDGVIVKLEVIAGYQNNSIFLPLVDSINNKNMHFEHRIQKSYSYIKAGV